MPETSEKGPFDVAGRALVDPFGRTISYVRVSVTDRCDFRCTYCMSDAVEFLPRRDLLTLEELDRLCSAFVSRGTRKLRITGGEPLVRRGVMGLFEGLSRHLASGALDELTLTTNGSQLGQFAGRLAACGVRRVNVSLDTLDPVKFKAITRRGDLATVLVGIEAARRAGLAVKINVVALRGFNDDEFERLVRWAHGSGMGITFIEVMPLGEERGDEPDRFLSLAEVESKLSDRLTLSPLPNRTGGPARYVSAAESGGRIGFITPLSHNFCESCNRVRVTCTGTLYMCLGQNDAADLREPLRSSNGDGPLMEALDAAIARKPKGHDFVADRILARPRVSRPMSMTGG